MPAKASRAAFGEALVELGAKDDRIVTVDADLSKSTMTAKFAKTYPSRAFNVGIAESGMIGLAAGLALAAALPDLPFACGLGTAPLLAGDVVADPLVPEGGVLPVRRPEPDPALLARWAVVA